MSSARVTRKLCLVMGRVMPVMSISWKASVPRTLEETWPVMATMGMESSMAVARPVTRLVAPGPEVAMQTPGRAGGARVAVGHVRGALLVAHEHVVDGGELAQRVVDGKDGSAGIAEDGGDAFAGERGPEDLGAGEGGVLVGLMVRVHWTCSLAQRVRSF